jgi:DNA mismatch repair ATPase MutS
MINSLEGLCTYLDENVMDEEHPLRIVVLDPMRETMENFAKLKELLEGCIDIGRARQNEYIINPNYSEELGELHEQMGRVKAKIEILRSSVEDDLCVKRVTLDQNNRDGFCFETDKKGADNGMRKSNNNYKVLSMKMGKTSFTCQPLRELVLQHQEL